MKISGAEFIEWYEHHWPFEGDDWYHENGEIETHNAAGDWALVPAEIYDSDDLGELYYQGRDADPTRGEGYSVTSLIKAWRRTRDFDVLTVQVPKSRTSELRAFLADIGAKTLR